MSHSHQSLPGEPKDDFQEQLAQSSPCTSQDTVQTDFPPSSIDHSRRSRCFIDTLFPEILLQIFLLIGYANQPFVSYHALDVSWVSRRWRAIATQNPLLWSNIHFFEGGNISFPRLYLERSANVPLQLSFRFSRFRGPPNQISPQNSQALEKALSLALPHVHRWERVICHITPRNRMELFLDRLKECAAAPLLKSLEITSRASDSLDPPGSGSTIFHGITPLLETVLLGDVFLDWRSAHFRNLQTLHLFNAYENPASSIQSSDLIHILRASPQLTSLKIHRFTHPSWDQQQDAQMIELHSLSHLGIVFHATEHARALFALLSAPNLMSLEMDVRASEPNCDSLLEALCQPQSSTKIPVLGRVQVLRLRNIVFSTTSMRRAFKVMPSLRHLHLWSNESFENEVVDCLAIPLSDKERTTESPILCPGLTTIQFNKTKQPSIERLVRARMDMGFPLKKYHVPVGPIIDESFRVWLQDHHLEVCEFEI